MTESAGLPSLSPDSRGFSLELDRLSDPPLKVQPQVTLPSAFSITFAATFRILGEGVEVKTCDIRKSISLTVIPDSLAVLYPYNRAIADLF